MCRGDKRYTQLFCGLPGRVHDAVITACILHNIWIRNQYELDKHFDNGPQQVPLINPMCEKWCRKPIKETITDTTTPKICIFKIYLKVYHVKELSLAMKIWYRNRCCHLLLKLSNAYLIHVKKKLFNSSRQQLYYWKYTIYNKFIHSQQKCR